MVVGENLKFVSALIVPAVEGLKEWCQKHDIAWSKILPDMIRHPRVLERYQMLVERINPNFSHATGKKIHPAALHLGTGESRRNRSRTLPDAEIETPGYHAGIRA